LEGIVGKRRGSRYLPGKRTDAWIKIKRRHSMVCARGQLDLSQFAKPEILENLPDEED
jgi:ATP-dependent DNA ligase